MKDEPVFRLRASDVVARTFGNETIVLDLRTSLYLSTNPTATVLWHSLEHGTTRSAMVEALTAEFEVTRELAQIDVDAFIEDCKKRGLIEEQASRPNNGL